MSIAGERPESGVRIVLERPRAASSPPWNYAGAAELPETSFPLRVAIDGEGEVTVDLGSASDATPPPRDLAERVRLIVRTAFRQAKADGEPPAWRIVRWRPAGP